ncbi:hypothetical protein AVKW3434_14575 [Acidovorax sp. SUPP3434]|uniref:hypothetical protein n=1 Tax=Acidovorax sp. SUPP3434 TaxID=2920880 RepID=UPI0023DE5868|nr:hypothetical protein [Acidovorax sp. SUPP3434]GKT00626.1 hypothetical protein AVKW3434_14575 [Acidovorax sp. SUPP3434]
MTKITLTLLLGLSGATVSWATTPVPASAYAPQAIGRIANIQITNGSAKSVQGGDANCENLSIDTRRVAYFWQHAVRSARYNYLQSLDQGDCQAEAQLQLPNRKKGRLSLDNATGWGVLQIHQTTYYLYCEACEGLMGADFTFPSVK